MTRWKTLILLAFAFVAGCATTQPMDSASQASRWDLQESRAHYDITATLGPDKTIDAEVVITLQPETANAGPGFILAERFEATVETSAPADISIAVDDEPVAGTKHFELKFKDEATAPVSVAFRYRGPLNPENEDLYTAATDDQIELRADMLWFPIFRNLNLPFTLDLAFSGLPQDFTVVSQGDIARSGDTVRINRSFQDIDAPFIAAQGLIKQTAPGIEVYAADFDWPITDMFRRHATKAADFYQDWFGPLPDGDVRLVILPEPSGAYARRSYIVLGEARDEAAKVKELGMEMPEYGPARLVAHEYAHAWWAPVDSLSEHRWLAESVAEYLSLRYLEHNFGLLTAHRLLERKRERAEAAPPLLGHGDISGDAMYQRGPHLLFDLEEEIGRESLDKILAWLGRNPPHDTADFMDVLREIAGADAVDYFDKTMRSGPGPWKEEEENLLPPS